MLKVLCSGDTAINCIFFFNPLPPPARHILQQLHGPSDRRKATIAHYSRKLLMKVLIKYIFNYFLKGITNRDGIMTNLLQSI